MAASNATRYGRERPRFTDADVAAMVARFDRGERPSAIALAYGCTTNAVTYRLRQRGRALPSSTVRDARPVPLTQRCCGCSRLMGLPGLCLDCLERAATAADVDLGALLDHLDDTPALSTCEAAS